MTADSNNNAKQITFSLGSPENRGRSKNTKESWRKFKRRFENPWVTPEKYHQFKKFPDKRQQALKNSNGWFIRCPVKDGVRNRDSILPSDLITLDVDYATPEYLDRILSGEVLPGIELFVHSSRSHTPEKPRLRIGIPVKGKVSADRYQAASRIVAQMADPELEYIDKVSSRPAQMMFLPTCSVDMEKHYVFYEQAGELLDVEDMIETWELTNGSADDIGNLPRYKGEDELRQAAEKAEDPLEKDGPIGDWCRAWSITELVMGREDGTPGPLADIYEPTEWSQGAITRMTYKHGSTSNGAVVYEDKFIFSHHGSDPTQEMLVNAYDAVRVHLFGDKDKKVDPDEPMGKRPSVEEMKKFMGGDSAFRQQQAESRYDMDSKLLDDATEDMDIEIDEDYVRPDDDDDDLDAEELLGRPLDSIKTEEDRHIARRRAKAPKPPKRWIAKELELTDDGIIKTTMHNIALIIMNDPRFWRRIGYNEFNYQIVVTSDIKSRTKLIPEFIVKDRVNGDRWQEINDIIIRATIEGPAGKGQPGYGIKVGKEMVHDAVRLAAMANRFHPVIEFLEDCYDDEKHDPECLETVFIDYYGAEDNVYTRQASKMAMIAAVARVMEPGCKFDFAVIFEGPQGIGKSSGVKALIGKEWFGEIDVDLKDRKSIAEQIAGKWALELPELSAMHKSEANDAKAFMTRQHDDVRMSYDRNISILPRQCIIFGTTNDREYLRDTTGNRRYWPIFCHTNSVDTVGLALARRRIWKAAYVAYLEMRKAQPHGELPLFLTGEAAEIAEKLQHAARKKEVWETWLDQITDWMDAEHSLQSFLAQNGYDIEDTLPDSHDGVSLEATVCRVAFSMEDAIREGLGLHGNVPNGAQADTFWQKAVSTLIERGWTKKRIRIAGVQKTWVLRPDITDDERRRGFRICEPTHVLDSADTQVDDDDDFEDLI